MRTEPTYSLLPALQISTRPVSGIAKPWFPRQNREPYTLSRKMAAFDYNPGEPRGTYNNDSRMTYPAARAAGRIVNIYV